MVCTGKLIGSTTGWRKIGYRNRVMSKCSELERVGVNGWVFRGEVGRDGEEGPRRPMRG